VPDLDVIGLLSVTDAKDFMAMNVIAQKIVTPEDATVPVWNLL
jgi:hypothetical protein